MSHSIIALYPAISMVIDAIIRRKGENQAVFVKYGRNRIRRNTPAVTKVDECTKALTGVGAAIAAGSHGEKGIWALFVIAAKVIAKVIIVLFGEFHMDVISQWP